MLNLKLRKSSSATGDKGVGGVLAGMTGVITGITVGTPPSGADPLWTLQGMLAGTAFPKANSPKRRRKSLSDQHGSKNLTAAGSHSPSNAGQSLLTVRRMWNHEHQSSSQPSKYHYLEYLLIRTDVFFLLLPFGITIPYAQL